MNMGKKSKNILRIEKWLAKIGYTIRHHGCGHWYIYDHEGDITDWLIYGEVDTRIYTKPTKTYQSGCCFYLSSVKTYVLKSPKGEPHCVGFCAKNNRSVFVQFYNHTSK